MKKACVLSTVVVASLAGSAIAAIDNSTINGLQLVRYENFEGNGALLPSTASMNGDGGVPLAYNQITPMALGGNHLLDETYPALSPGYANRHTLWASADGGNTAYQLQAGDSFRVSACFRIAPTPPYPTGIGAPANSETGFWIHNPRVGNDSNGNPTVNYVDEGGVWLITNGTSFSGGAGMDFFLFGEGGHVDPGHPPITGVGDIMEIVYTYYAPNYFGAGSPATYEATVSDLNTAMSVYSGLLHFNTDALGRDGLNPGAVFGFRYQNQIFPPIVTDVSTNIFNIHIIPTPGTAALLGLGGLVSLRRRR